jgi:hypothetical protein
MVERGQEPYIADKMANHMEEAGFDIVHCIKKDTFPGKKRKRKIARHHLNIDNHFCIGKPDQLNQEFLWDLRSIFKSGQPFLADDLGISDDKYPAFLDQLVAELQQQDIPSKWSMVSTMGRKSL